MLQVRSYDIGWKEGFFSGWNVGILIITIHGHLIINCKKKHKVVIKMKIKYLTV